MNSGIICCVCGTPMDIRETWTEINEEYKHLEYCYCESCQEIRTIEGQPIPAKPIPEAS